MLKKDPCLFLQGSIYKSFTEDRLIWYPYRNIYFIGYKSIRTAARKATPRTYKVKNLKLVIISPFSLAFELVTYRTLEHKNFHEREKARMQI